MSEQRQLGDAVPEPPMRTRLEVGQSLGLAGFFFFLFAGVMVGYAAGASAPCPPDAACGGTPAEIYPIAALLFAMSVAGLVFSRAMGRRLDAVTFNPPPGWPPPPHPIRSGGWRPLADWPPAPRDWTFWTLEQHGRRARRR